MIVKICLCKVKDFYGAPEYFPDHPDTFQIIRAHVFLIIKILCRSSKHFEDHLDTFQIIQTLYKSFGHFSYYLDTFQVIRMLSRSPRHFAN